jgi:hypothetical protein
MEVKAAAVEEQKRSVSVATRHWVLMLLVAVFAYFATRIAALLHTAVGEGLFSLLFGARFLGFYWPWFPVFTVPSGVPKAFIEVTSQPATATQVLFAFGGVLTTALAGGLVILWLNKKRHDFHTGLFLRVLAVVLLLDLPTALLARTGYLSFVERSWGLPRWVFSIVGLGLIASLVWPLAKSWLRHLSTSLPVNTQGGSFLAYLSTLFVPFYLFPQIANLVFGRFEEPFFRTGAIWASLLVALVSFLLLPKRLFASRERPQPSVVVRPAILAISLAALVLTSWLGSQIFGTGADYFRMKGLFWGRYQREQPALGNLHVQMLPDGNAEIVAKIRPRLPAESWWQKQYRSNDPEDWRPYLAAFQWNVTRLFGLKLAAIRGLEVETRNDPDSPFFLFEQNATGARVLRATVDMRPLLRRQGASFWLSVRLAAKREVNWEEIRISAAEGLEIDNYDAAIPPLRVPRATVVGETIGYLGLPDEQRAQPEESSGSDLLWRRSKRSEMPANIRVRFRSTRGTGAMPLLP